MAIGRVFLDTGQLDVVFGQLKVEHHLPGGRQYQNIVEACRSDSAGPRVEEGIIGRRVLSDVCILFEDSLS